MKGPGGKTSTFSASMIDDSPTRRYKNPANEGKIASVLLGNRDDPQLRQQEFSLLASDPASSMKQSIKKTAKAISKMASREITFTGGVRPNYNSKVERLLNHNAFAVLMTVITLYALFGDDVRILAFPKAADNYFDALTLIAILMYTIEIILSCIDSRAYLGSFFFWLDLISTLSMVFDVSVIFSLIDSQTTGTVDIMQTSRAARVTRIIRFVRLLRLVRIVKLYKESQILLKKRNDQIKTVKKQEKAVFKR